MKALSDIIKNFKKLKVCVIGDAMLDIYLHGNAERISREAPVPVVDMKKTIGSGGGAANTAINIADLGAKSYFVSVVGKDEDGRILKQILKKKGVISSYIIETAKRLTLTKKRVIANSQVIVRVDSGNIDLITRDIEEKVIEKIKTIYKMVDAVILSDYGYGMITPKVKKAVEELQKTFKKILVVDAKNLQHYHIKGTTLVKPNFDEALRLIGTKGGTAYKSRTGFIKRHGESIRQLTNASIAAVTIDKNGALIFDGQNKPYRTASKPGNNKNAIGAGDTYSSTFTLALAAKADKKEAADLAALASSIVLKKTGTITCSYQSLLLKTTEKESLFSNKIIKNRKQLKHLIAFYRKQNKTIVFTNGCFDILHSGHVTYLAKAKSYGEVLIVGLNSDKSVKRLKGEDRPINNEVDRANVLASLASVSNIITFSENTPINLIKIVKPDYYVKGGDYSRETLPETPYVEMNKGKIVIIPLVSDKSTTNIINKIKKSEEDINQIPNTKRYYSNYEA